MWRGGADLAMDQTSHSMDTANRPSPYTPGLDNETPVPAMAALATPDSVMDTGLDGVVQNQRSSSMH